MHRTKRTLAHAAAAIILLIAAPSEARQPVPSTKSEIPKELLPPPIDMRYIDKLKASPVKLERAETCIKEARTSGITNPMSIAALLAVISKESDFKMAPEKSYANTSVEDIRHTFKSRVREKTDQELETIKKDPYDFFELVYGRDSGASLGNIKEGDGYKYRGRGLNQITGRTNYAAMEKLTGLKLTENPDLLNDFNNAAKTAIHFILHQFEGMPKKQIAAHGTNDPNKVASIEQAAGLFYNANAGWGKTEAQCELEEPYWSRTQVRAEQFFEWLKELSKQPTNA